MKLAMTAMTLFVALTTQTFADTDAPACLDFSGTYECTAFMPIPANTMVFEQTTNEDDTVVLTMHNTVAGETTTTDFILDGEWHTTYSGECTGQGFSIVVGMGSSVLLTSNYLFSLEGDFRLDAQFVQAQQDGWGETTVQPIQRIPTTFCKKVTPSE